MATFKQNKWVNTLALSGSAASNYTLTTAVGGTVAVTGKPITVTAVSATKIYDGTTSSSAVLPSYDTGQLYCGDTAVASQTFATRDVGSGINLIPNLVFTDGNGGANYTAVRVNGTGTITPKALTVSGSIASNKTYDGTTAEVLGGTPVFQAAEAAGAGTTADGKPYNVDSVSALGPPVGVFATPGAGTGIAVTVSGVTATGAGASNYTVTQQAGLTANIAARPVQLAGNKDYNGTTTVVAENLTVPNNLDDGNLTLSGSATLANRNIGDPIAIASTSGLTLGGSQANNYTLVGASGAVAVAKTNLTVTASANSKLYDGSITALAVATVQPGGIQPGDIAPSWTETYNNRNAGSGKTLTPAALLVNDGNSGANYAYNYVPENNGTITQIPLTITAQPNTKMYDGTVTAATRGILAVTNIISPDIVSVWPETYDNINVGTSKTLTPGGVVADGNAGLSGVVADGNAGLNYSYNYVQNHAGAITNLVITPSEQPVSFTGCLGSPAVFATTVPGVGLSYQWQVSYDYAITYTNLVDATNASYTNPAVALADSGNFYQVIVSGPGTATITSAPPAELTVSIGLSSSANPVNQTVCSGAPTAVLHGIIGNGAYVALWSGAGTFSPTNNVLDVTYTPSADEIAAGIAIVTLTGSQPGSVCAPAVSTATIVILPGPVVHAGPNQTVCADAPRTQLAGAIGGTANSFYWSGAGTFVKNVYETNAIYVPTVGEIAAGSATVTLTASGPSGPCAPVTSTMTISISPAATAAVGPNQTICSSDVTAALGGTVGGAATGGLWTASPGGGTFLPDATSLNATYTPSAADITAQAVTLTLHATGQLLPCLETAQMVVTIHPLATGAGANQTICSIGTAALSGTVGGGATGGTWSTAGTGTFVPNNTALNATYHPLASDKTARTETLTLTTTGQLSPCTPATTQLVVTIHALPAITSQPINLTVCAGHPATFAVETTGTALTYQWQESLDFGESWNDVTDETNASYTIPATGLIADDGKLLQVIVSGACAPAVTSTPPAELTVNDAPTVQAGPSQTVCASSPATLLAGSFGGLATSATWSGAGVFVPNATTLHAVYTPTATEITAGSATVTLTTDNPGGTCPAASDTMTITINPVATASAGPNQTLCSSSPAAQLAGSFGGVATSATWSGAGTFVPSIYVLNPVYTPTTAEISAGSATVTLTSNDPIGPCPRAVSTMTVTIHHPSDITGQPVSLTNCAGSPATFTVAASGTGLLYLWQLSLDNGTNWEIISDSATNASYTIPAPTLSQSSNQFHVIVSSAGCPGSHTSDAATLTVYELPAVTSSPTNLTLCAGSPAIFYSTSTGVGLSYQWQVSTDGGTTYANILPDASNEYSSTNPTYGEYVTTVAENGNEYRVIVSGTCTPSATSAPPAVLTIHTPATASAGANQTICSIGTADLSGTVNGGATGGKWSGGTGSFRPNPTALNATYHPSPADISAGSVTLTLTTTGQLTPCPAVTSQTVVTIQPVAVVSVGANQTICSSASTLGLGGTVSGGTTTGQWTTAGTGTFAPDATTLNATYTPSADDATAGTVTLTLTSTG
ncbi:MAG: YDG domain-containing protein, partial [Verrucomicrobia bacterium]|nr:YDG domain-containing protein [Verrucomicrobiota bacterium]